MTMNISPNATDSEDEELSNEELSRKIKSFCNLCMENKINTSNAFDLNMAGYFYKWLTKKKHESDCDVASFHELADYLDTTGKIYCYRVDNADENLNKLIHEVRNTHYKNGTTQSVNDDEGKMLKREKPIKTKLMLTTADKLSNKSLGLCLNNVNFKFTFQELFKTGRPANYITSMYYDIPLKTELMQMKENKVENKNNNKYKMKNIKNEISKSHICSEFFEFVAEHDKNSNYDNANSKLENIEDYFHCEIEPCQAFKMNYISTESNIVDECYDEPINNNKSINDDSNLIATNDRSINNNEFGNTVNDNRSLLFDQLVDCIDYEQRDYSYFNPKLLAHWSGPTAWKATAMMKALKSYKPNKHQNIQISTPDVDDEANKENIDNNKETNKKRANKSENVKEIKWLTMKEIEPLLKKMTVGKEQILPHILAKWHPLNNRADPPPFQIYFKYPHLKYIVSQPNCIKSHTNKIKEPCVESTKYTLNSQITGDLSHTVLVDNSCNFDNSDINKSQKDNFENENVDDSILETNMDISELKNKIMKILNRKCVEFELNCEWSNNLAFSDLLTQLNVNIENDEMSVGLIYVGLLHLTNEIGLKVVQGYNSVTKLEDIFIAKPANK